MTRYRIVPDNSNCDPRWRLERQTLFGWHLLALSVDKNRVLDLLAHLRQSTEYYRHWSPNEPSGYAHEGGSVKHTPGPWKVGEMRGQYIDVNHCNKHQNGAISLTLAKVTARPTWLSESEANARLIASAPTMYAKILQLAILGDQEAKRILEEINGDS